MRLHKRITALGLSAVMISSISSMPALATSIKPYEWNGVSPLKENMTYYITESVTVDGDFTLPSDSVMLIQSGASINVPVGSSLSLLGDITVEKGAGAIVSGQLTVTDTADFAVLGYFSAGGKSKLNLKGRMYCGNTSSASLDGETNIAESGSFSSHGNVYIGGTLISRSDFNSYSGAVTISGNADFGGATALSGLFRVAGDGNVTNSGTMTLNENCRYITDGSFKNENGGYVDDNRKLYDEDAMSVARMSLYATDTPLYGIDVSTWQGEIDWAKVKADGVDYAIIRSSRGPLSADKPMAEDDMFHTNMLGAMNNDIPVGIYHYCYGETVEQVREEARFVLSLIDGYDLKYPVMFDIEDEWYIKNGYSVETLTAMTEAFCEEIKNAGYIPMIYSYASFFDSYLDMELLSQYPVAVAHVNTDAPDYDGEYFIWQYSWEGQVDGIDGNVDLDYSYLDFTEYTEMFKLNRQ